MTNKKRVTYKQLPIRKTVIGKKKKKKSSKQDIFIKIDKKNTDMSEQFLLKPSKIKEDQMVSSVP